MKNLVKCGKWAKMKCQFSEQDSLPFSWEETEAGDLCHKCLEKWKSHRRKFTGEKKVENPAYY